ncbi:deoxyribonuclease IV [Urbifossiella limnaea]|uniref:Probable endonuclease 4 n=1 Tax=Urbifossiella limnaea TaxID=2528023 RepID=A0A517XR37_9BACT|nr:deoxyribonuclease IV [Urbifossiella limnaea]QDU19975.1 Endonuclease 4 [Urbifossiella limnaea]
MPLFGAHLSVAGGLHKAPAAAAELGMDTVQVFTANPNAWAAKKLDPAAVAAFKQAVAASGVQYPTAHDSYLINLAAPDDGLWHKSIDAFAAELDRSEELGLSYVVTHPGAHVGTGVEAGVTRVVAALDIILERCRGYRVRVLLETTAGQGTTLGAAFDELAAMLDRVKQPERLGVCLDTCHVFAAGYPLGTAADYADTFGQFDRLIGLKRLCLFHVNDSLKPLGSRVDRHAGIGLGEMGDEPFRRLVRDPRFADMPMILETPKEDAAGNPMDAVNLARLKGFAAPPSSKRKRRVV